MNELIYGKNELTRIVSVEPGPDGTAEIFRELEDGSVVSTTVPNSYFILYTENLNPKFKRLSGNQPYKYMVEYPSYEKYREVLSSSYKKRYDLYTIRDPKESMLVKDGYTYFKGMKVEDVSVLSFDIETTGLTHDKNSKVLLISNTFRRNGKVTKRLFSLDDYIDQQTMISEWCRWVCLMDPSVVVGHNLYGFDLPYLHFCSGKYELQGLFLGRNGSAVKFAGRNSQFRKDGSQAYDYENAYIYGREIVDTWFLSMKYDVSARREYESYQLKEIVKHEKLARPGRQYYDGAKIKDNWHDPVEREKIKAYAIDDADEALALYDLMIPSLFYYAQSIPRSFQAIVNTATGSQINSLMVRSYLQQGHSIARGSEKTEYEGAIAFGVSGIHKNVFKIDVQSLYPSIILSEKLWNKEKDPQGLFLKIVEYFTAERIRNKEQGETTGQRYFKDLSDSQKIVINSMYGFLGAPKLNYNSPKDAARITEVGRNHLKQTIKYLSGKNYVPAETSETDAA